MRRIKRLVEQINDELDSSKEYMEEALMFKAKGEATWYARYKSMAEQELQHSSILHERAVQVIEELRKVYTPPEEMLEKWEHEHREYIEKTAWLKQMLAM